MCRVQCALGRRSGRHKQEESPAALDALQRQRERGLKRIRFLVALILLVGCTPHRPRVPHFSTATGQDCGKKCLKGHTWCMDAACPAKATSSCRPKCDQKLRDCYEACLEGEVKYSRRLSANLLP